MTPEWCVIVPVKQWRSAKSRLELPATTRMRVARALAADTLAALAGARSVSSILVVAERVDSVRTLLVRSRLPIGRFTLVRHPDGDLNDAVRAAARHARHDHAGPVAVMPADLASVTSAEIDAALARCGRFPRAVVSDRQNTGTVLLAAQRAELLEPAFGIDSLARHVSTGAVPIQVPENGGLRSDVDLPADLATATGPRTRAVVRRLGRRSPYRHQENRSYERTFVLSADRSPLRTPADDSATRVSP